jgi:hypothetical protein
LIPGTVSDLVKLKGEIFIMDNPSNSSMSEDERKERYSINENLLQSYRQIFISSESFLLAVGTLALEQDIAVFLIIAII